jgi:hypothetical protein
VKTISCLIQQLIALALETKRTLRFDCTTMASVNELPPAFLDPVIQGFANALRIPSVLWQWLLDVIPTLTHRFTVAYLVVNVAFTSLLVPGMLIALFYFSVPSTRTSPVFVCAVGAIFFGALQGTTLAGTMVRPRPSNSRSMLTDAYNLTAYRFGISSNRWLRFLQALPS